MIASASQIADDFLDHFKVLLSLIENFPLLPEEVVDGLTSWTARTYREYLQNSGLPEGVASLKSYEELPPEFRRDFELMVARLNVLAFEGIRCIQEHREDGANFCARTVTEFRASLTCISEMVKHGHEAPSADGSDGVSPPFVVKSRPFRNK